MKETGAARTERIDAFSSFNHRNTLRTNEMHKQSAIFSLQTQKKLYLSAVWNIIFWPFINDFCAFSIHPCMHMHLLKCIWYLTCVCVCVLAEAPKKLFTAFLSLSTHFRVEGFSQRACLVMHFRWLHFQKERMWGEMKPLHSIKRLGIYADGALTRSCVLHFGRIN
jgi:hypothetical protein